MGVGQGEEASRWGPCLTWVRAGLFQRSVISLRFSGRSSSCSACAASSMFLQKGSSHTGLALPGKRNSPQHKQTTAASLTPSRAWVPRLRCLLLPYAARNLAALDPDVCRQPPVISAYPELARVGRDGVTGQGQGLLALKVLKASDRSRVSVMPHMACLTASLRRAERCRVSTSCPSLATKPRRPSLGSNLPSREAANLTHQRSTCWCLACP